MSGSASTTEDLSSRSYAHLEKEFGQANAGLRVLDMTAQTAPLLGHFERVLGMIDAFCTLQYVGSTADPSELAGGIRAALMTTAAGSVVAVPVSFLLSWFDGRLARRRELVGDAVEAP